LKDRTRTADCQFRTYKDEHKIIVGFVLFAQLIDKECVAPFVIFYDTPLSEKPSFVED
jgi:hypothetical protein